MSGSRGDATSRPPTMQETVRPDHTMKETLSSILIFAACFAAYHGVIKRALRRH